MRLASKIAVAVSAVFALVLACAIALVAFEEIEFTDEEIDLHGRLLGRVVARMAVEVWRERGIEEARALVKEVDQHEPTIAIRWLDLRRRGDEPVSEAVAAALYEGEVVGRVSSGQHDTMHTYVPLQARGQTRHVVVIAESLSTRNQHMETLILRLALISLAGFLLSSGAAFLIGRSLVGRRVSDLVTMAEQVGAGNLEQRVPIRGGDELTTVGRAMNDMAARIAAGRAEAEEHAAAQRQAERQLAHADRLATIGGLASRVAHEIATPLQAITISAHLIDDTVGDQQEVNKRVAMIERQAARVSDMVRKMLRFSREQKPNRAPCDLRVVVQNALDLFSAVRGNPKLEIVRHTPAAPCIARVDAQQLEQVITNLLHNAAQASPAGGRIEVGIDRVRATPPEEPGRELEMHRLFVSDEGDGIDPEVLPHVFDPFFTTKPEGEGTGLGLSVSYRIVRDHGGFIEVDSVVGRGTRFEVLLPVADEPPARA